MLLIYQFFLVAQVWSPILTNHSDWLVWPS